MSLYWAIVNVFNLKLFFMIYLYWRKWGEVLSGEGVIITWIQHGYRLNIMNCDCSRESILLDIQWYLAEDGVISQAIKIQFPW